MAPHMRVGIRRHSFEHPFVHLLESTAVLDEYVHFVVLAFFKAILFLLFV